MMNIPFTKMQGLGNDFAVIDATRNVFSLSSDQIQQMADRRTGIGFDQLLVLESSEDEHADFVYRIFNADGGEVGQCGNGARCMALFIRDHGLSDCEQLTLQTREGLLNVRILKDDRVEVDMGRPCFVPADIPFVADQEAQTYQLMLDNQNVVFSVVNVGNPHAVITVDDVDTIDLQDLGKRLGSDAHFPEGANVSVMQVIDNTHIHVRVFERGVGETQACGSAACAAVAVGRQQGLLTDTVTVLQSGGALEVRWQGLEHPIEMVGPAAIVYRGEWQI